MRWPAILINLLYPPACLVCHAALCTTGGANARPPDAAGEAARQLLCGRCAELLQRVNPPLCSRCGVGLPGAFDAIVQCATCRTHPRAFEQALAPWRYEGTAGALIRQFKYHRRWRIGRWLAEQMVATAQRSLPLEEVAAVLPVPLHWLKRHLRGTNPSEELATIVAQSLKKPCLTHALRRHRWTRTQTQLGWRQRARNVQQAFVARERFVRDRTLLLIDDVLTSGATAEACARALTQAGARRVFVLTAARTPLE